MSSQSQHVGPVIFANETARAQLVEESEVISFRPHKRTSGRTWWRESRTGKKRGDCTIHLEEELLTDRTMFERYADLSGFDSADDWMAAIEDMHGEMPDSGYFYRVRSLNDSIGDSDG